MGLRATFEEPLRRHDGPPLRGITGHRRLEGRREPGRHLAARRLLVHDPVERAQQVVAHLVRRAALQRVEQRGAPRPDVTGRRCLLAGGHLGGEVGRRSGHQPRLGQRRVGRGARNAEVGQLHLAVGRHQDVGGLHVAVHDPGAVRGGQCAGDLGEDRRGVVGAEPAAPADQLGQVGALDVLHHQPLVALPVDGLLDQVEDRDDVGVVELGGQLGLALGAPRVGSDPAGSDADLLQGDRTPEDLVAAAPDGAHAAAADLGLERVPASDHPASLPPTHSTEYPGNQFARTAADGRGL